MKRKAVGTQKKYGSLLMAMIIVLSVVPAWAQDKVPTLSSPTGAAGQPAGKIRAQAVGPLTCNLWNQPQSSVNSVAYANQDFETANDALDIFLADDFTTKGKSWRINNIFVPGALWNIGGTTLANAVRLHFEIYRDSGGRPDGDPKGGGNPPIWSLAVPPTDSRITIAIDSLGTQGNVTLTLAAPATLSGGKYWFVFYPELDFGTSGQYGRFTADTTNLFPAKVINPDEGWPGAPASWSDASGVHGFSQQDLAFCLQGEDFYWPMFLPATNGIGTN